jgi:uncharacterized membrane protein YdfJ with MMPL/SSD domain
MLEFLFVTLLALVALPLRWRALTADQRFTRRYLVAIALVPGLVLLCVGAVTGMKLRPAWGMRSGARSVSWSSSASRRGRETRC